MLLRFITATALAATMAAPAQADLHFDFDTGSQGWTVEAGGALATVTTGGESGGYLRFTDISSDDMLAVLSPGNADWSAYLGGTLRFSARIDSNHQPDWAGFGEVSFSGAAGTVVADVVPAGQPLANGQWQQFSVPISAAVFGTGLPAVLASVSRLSIKTEYAISDPNNAATFESLGLDNVSVSAVPDAPTWALLLAGALLLPALHWRRRATSP